MAYPIGEIGESIDKIVCKFHGFSFDNNGNPLNNDLFLKCQGNVKAGKSGLIFQNFNEENHKWVQDIINVKDSLYYSHTRTGTSNGSFLWMMESGADLLHVRKGGIHPKLQNIVDMDNIIMDQGDGWAIQYWDHGWWLFIYPYTFIEFSAGCLVINYTIPKSTNSEFGFDWATQFYYTKDSAVDFANYLEIEENFIEDVQAIEKQKGTYFPLLKASSRFEDHCVHFGQWVIKNRKN